MPKRSPGYAVLSTGWSACGQQFLPLSRGNGAERLSVPTPGAVLVVEVVCIALADRRREVSKKCRNSFRHYYSSQL